MDESRPRLPRQRGDPARRRCGRTRLRYEERIRLPIRKTKRFPLFGRPGSASSLLPLGLVVFLVRQHASDIEPLAIVMNRGNQADLLPPMLNTVSLPT